MKAVTVEEQRIHVDEADLVIWACGYQSNEIPIIDSGKPIKYSTQIPNTQHDVDGKCRIMLSEPNIVLSKCFAAGVGFPVRTKDGGVGK